MDVERIYGTVVNMWLKKDCAGKAKFNFFNLIFKAEVGKAAETVKTNLDFQSIPTKKSLPVDSSLPLKPLPPNHTDVDSGFTFCTIQCLSVCSLLQFGLSPSALLSSRSSWWWKMWQHFLCHSSPYDSLSLLSRVTNAWAERRQDRLVSCPVNWIGRSELIGWTYCSLAVAIDNDFFFLFFPIAFHILFHIFHILIGIRQVFYKYINKFFLTEFPTLPLIIK